MLMLRIQFPTTIFWSHCTFKRGTDDLLLNLKKKRTLDDSTYSFKLLGKCEWFLFKRRVVNFEAFISCFNREKISSITSRIKMNVAQEDMIYGTAWLARA